jgi:hypothetical protein
MMTPDGTPDELQKLYLAYTPFNVMLREYFGRRGNGELIEYFDRLLHTYVRKYNITPEKIIDQIEEQYKEYLANKSIDEIL